jgi:NADPH2:quinone reductase
MRAVMCRDWAEYESLPLEDVPSPAMRPGGVRIAIKAAGMSFATALVVTGRYQVKPPRPFTPGTDIAGIVTEVAPGVTRVKPGDRVMAAIDWGGHSEEVVAWQELVWPMPAGLDFAAATQMPLSYGTSYTALDWCARLRPGEWLLVHGAGGAVGLAAVELGKAMGARVIASAASAAKRDVALAHGADHAIDNTTGELKESVRAITGDGADVIFDPIGGDLFDASLRAINPEGRILVIGFAAGRIQQIPANLLLVKNVAALGFNYGRYIGWGPQGDRAGFAPKLEGVFAQMSRWVAEGKLRPTASPTFPLAQYREAMTAVRNRQGIGKVALVMGSDRS